MKKKSASRSAFFNLRVLIGLFVVLAGVFLALVSLGTFSATAANSVGPQQEHKIVNIKGLPPGFDCAKIHQLGYDTMENFRAHLIMVACGEDPKGKPSPATAFSKLVKSLLPKLPSPLAYGATDVDLITSPPPENFPSVTQSETYTTANPDNPDQILAAYNDSSGAGNNPANYSGASFSSDGGLTFTRINPNPFAAAGDNFGDPIALYNKSTGTWHTIWIDTACGGFGLGGYKTTDPLNGPWSHYCVHNGSNDDRESAWVENNPSSPFFGRMYVSWNDYNVFNCGNIGCLFVTHSTDDGASWSTPVQVSPNGIESRDTQITGDMSGNGKVYVAGMNENGGSGNLARNILMYRSTDGGATFANTFTSATFNGGGVTAVGYFECMFPDNGGYWRHMSWGEPAAFNGVVHYVYTQHGTGSDAGDVYYIRSTDDGFTFSTPMKLNTDATTRPQWQANISESPGGTLLAVWYDGRDFPNCVYGDPNTPCYKMYARKSNDNGASWLADDTFSDVGSPLPAQPDFNVQGTYAGDYDYGSAILTKHLTSWVDGRVAISGQSQQDAFTDRELVGFAVTTSNPACNSIINTQPTDFVISLSDAVNTGTVQATDFTVNGTPANSFTFQNSNTQITFHFNSSPVVTQGVQTMNIPADSFTRVSDGMGNFEFNCSFCYAVMPLQVTTTNPPVGGTFAPAAPGDYEYDVNFNQAIDPASVDITDLTLTGNVGGSVTAVTVSGSTAQFTVHFNFGGSVTASIGAGAITAFGCNGNAAFTGSYTVEGCPPQNHYDIAQIGASIVPGTTDTGNHADDGTTPITLPFPYTIYDQTFTSANVDSNGTFQFMSPLSIFSNTCLPDTSRTYIIFPYWDDLRTDTNSGCSVFPNGTCGIFTSISGTAPNRIFNIEYRAVYFAAPTTTANFELRLYEGQSRFDVIYGTVANSNTSATAGVQKVTDFDQYFCNGSGGAATGGQSYILVTCSPSPTPTASPTATATATSTATATATATPTPTATARPSPTPRQAPTPRPRPTPPPRP
jgi:hypothetical protein